MNTFNAANLFYLSRVLEYISREDGIDNDPFDVAVHTSITTLVADLIKECRESNYRCPLATMLRLEEDLKEEGLTFGKVRKHIVEFQGRLQDDLEQSFFLSFTQQEHAMFVQNAPLMGDAVLKHFPDCTGDIQESGYCLALRRGTACVFHLMRVLEVGLFAVGTAMNIQVLENRSWGTMLERIKVKIDINKPRLEEAWTRRKKFYHDTYVAIDGVKRAWRDPAMHVTGTYTPDEALNIANHTRSLMMSIAMQINQAGVFLDTLPQDTSSSTTSGAS